LKYFCNILLIVLAIGLVQCDTGPAPDSAPSNKGKSIPVEMPPEYDPPSGIITGKWENVDETYFYSDAPVADSEGNLYYAAIFQQRIYKMTPAGETSVFDEGTARTMGLAFAADGRLIACRNLDAQIVAYDMQGGREVLMQGELTPDPASRGPEKKMEFCNGLVVSSSGDIWFNDRLNEQIIHLGPDGQHKVVASGFRPNGIILSSDEKMLVTTDSNKAKLWAFDVLEDGSLQEKPDFFDPVVVVDLPRQKASRVGKPGTNGMARDKLGRYYATSYVGVQVFDPEGKYLGLLKSPKIYLSGLAFAGVDSGYLYATGREGLYRTTIEFADVVE
jgi:gluconolactonase